LVKGKGHPRFLFMGLAKRSWLEIVVHIPRNLGGGETSLTESSSGRLEFKLSHIRLTSSVELRSDRCSGLVLFDQNCRMNRLKILTRQDRKWKNEIYGKQNYKDDKSFGYKLFVAIKCSDTLRLH
jgi:hypothetical protein